jgi:hypothetical protein
MSSFWNCCGGAEVCYGSSDTGREIDFLARFGDQWRQYQVADTLTDENRKRELGAFVLAAPHLGNDRTLLTLDDDEATIVNDGVEVRRSNLVKWLIE